MQGQNGEEPKLKTRLSMTEWILVPVPVPEELLNPGLSTPECQTAVAGPWPTCPAWGRTGLLPLRRIVQERWSHVTEETRTTTTTSTSS